MDPVTVAKVLAGLGIEGVDPSKLSALMPLLEELGASTQVNQEELKSYYPEVGDSDWYIPKAPKGFYTGCFEALREASKPDFNYLRKLTMPRFRRR